MNDEEAIKYLKQIKDKDLWKLGYVYGKEAIQTVLNLIEKQKAEIETLKRDFEIVDHECSRLEQEDIRKDKIINDAIKWIENTMNDTRVIGCNLGDLQLLLDILKDKK